MKAVSSVVTSECNSTPQSCGMLTQGVVSDMGGFVTNHDITQFFCLPVPKENIRRK